MTWVWAERLRRSAVYCWRFLNSSGISAFVATSRTRLSFRSTTLTASVYVSRLAPTPTPHTTGT